MSVRTAAITSALAAFACLYAFPLRAQQKLPEADRTMARALFQRLIESNTTHSAGNTTEIAQALQTILIDGGFFKYEVTVMGPDDRHGNLVVRLRGNPDSRKKPVLIICHLDVVEAKREDWTTDPFKLVEKDGFFYGRGTQDIKESATAALISFLRLRREGFIPDRDIILALTAGEEGGEGNGVEWLLRTHRDLIDAGFALNPDAGGVTSEKGKPVELGVEATEKLYADFRLTSTNAGGHSSVPAKDNALYHVADALGKIEGYTFPFELNGVTRAYFAAVARTASGQVAADMRSLAGPAPSPAAIRRLSANPHYNSTVRTTCVATMMSAGHAPNALPQRAEANVNCRILPGHTPAEVRAVLTKIIGDPQVEIRLLNDAGAPSNDGETEMSLTPPPLNKEVFDALRATVDAMWPGLPIIPEMETGASDSKLTMAAGIPSYGFSGMAIDEDDDRAHGKDERIGVESFYTGVQFDYLYLKRLTGGS